MHQSNYLHCFHAELPYKDTSPRPENTSPSPIGVQAISIILPFSFVMITYGDTQFTGILQGYHQRSCEDITFTWTECVESSIMWPAVILKTQSMIVLLSCRHLCSERSFNMFTTAIAGNTVNSFCFWISIIIFTKIRFSCGSSHPIYRVTG